MGDNGLKRMTALFVTLMLVLSGLIIRLASEASPGTRLARAAAVHGSYTVGINSTRGTIYDSGMRPLVNDTPAYYALVSPNADDIPRQLTGLTPFVSDINLLEKKLASGMPFSIEITSPDVNIKGVTVVSGVKRYSDNMAPQLIGYLGSNGEGVAGIEKALNETLKKYKKELFGYYPVTAAGTRLEGLSAEIRSEGSDTGGVVLTIDKDIQLTAQQAAARYLGTGAVVVMDAENGDVLALASVPSFSPNKLAQAVKAQDSPMINRALSAYNLGSVFKTAVAAAALDSGVGTDFSYTCYGSINVSGNVIRCADGEVHGREDMAGGFADSCNGYFITLGQKTGKAALLDMAKRLGFGSPSTFYPGFSSVSGSLPTLAELDAPAALANFSIGEGSFMATPLQAARMICAVADGGTLPTPRLIKRTVDENLKTVKEYPATVNDRVFSASTAATIKNFMIKTVDSGTGTAARPAYGGAGGKTGTAETGIIKNGKPVIQAWFAGFYPAENPRYVIVALKENGTSGGADAAPAFKFVADSLAFRCGYMTPGQASD